MPRPNVNIQFSIHKCLPTEQYVIQGFVYSFVIYGSNMNFIGPCLMEENRDQKVNQQGKVIKDNLCTFP